MAHFPLSTGKFSRIRFRFPFLPVLVVLLLTGCATVPVTRRTQFNMLSEDRMLAMSRQQYRSFLEKERQEGDVLSPSESADARMVQQVGQRISSSVEAYLSDHGHKKQVKQFDWSFTLIDENQINAWAMPGGRTAIYTGILEVTQDASGLAVVMGHEIAHAVARHGNERMSQQLAAQLGGVALAVAVRNKPRTTQNLYMAAYGIGSQVGALLPFSRLHESEADKMGLVFMAMAGYDPREAPQFWKRMAEEGGKKPPVFLSTHPDDEQRIERLKQYMPKALEYYHPER